MAQTAPTVQSAREKLYGPTRLVNTAGAVQRMQKNNLMWKGEPYDNDESLDSVTTLSFRGQPLKDGRTTAKWTSNAQQNTNIHLGSTQTALKSATHAEYTGEMTPKVAALIPEGINDIHLADLAPQYMDDKSFERSLYQNSYRGKESYRSWSKQVEQEGPPTHRRYKTTLYQKATHFNLGSAKEKSLTETGSCFSEPGSVKTVSTSTEGKTHSCVFRPGDYDVTSPDEFISIQRKDYTLPSERELPGTFSAGISTKTNKPRFHISERKTAISGGTISALRKLLIEQNQSEFQNPRDPTSINLTKAFTKFDTNRSGFITADQLRNACQVIGATQDEVDILLKECDKAGSGKIDYNEFAKYLTAHTVPVDDDSYVSTHMESYRGSDQRDIHDDCMDIEYQTTAHFQLGNSTEEPVSVYHEDYVKSQRNEVKKTPRAPHPPSGKVIPEQPEYMKMGDSTKQGHFVAHSAAKNRLDNIKHNSDRHTRVSVVITCDKERDQESQLASMMRSSYRGAPAEPAKLLAISEKDCKHLESNRALLNPPKDFDLTESHASFQQPINDPNVAVQMVTDSITERSDRRGNNKSTHFVLGSDPTSNTTEHCEQFEPKHIQDVDTPTAGKKQGIPQGYSIIPEEENEEDPEIDDEQGSDVALQNVLKQRNYLKHMNPRDPLNLNLRKCFLQYDKDLSGTITVDEVREVCTQMKISIDENTLKDLLDRCDRNKDGVIDYHEFSMYLSRKGLPHTSSTTFSTIFREDYRHPLNQHMTGMQKLVSEQEPMRHKPIHTSHLFHMDYSDEIPQSTTRKDFIKPEQAL